MRHTFHQAAIAQEAIGEVVNDLVAIAVEFSGEQFFVNRHTHGVGDTLAERAGGGFNASGVAIFRVSRGAAVQLTELFEVFDAQVVAAQMEQRIEQHRAVTVGEYEAVSVWPGRVGRVVAEVLTPEHFGDFGHAERHTGVAGVGLLDGVHGEGANRARQFVIGRGSRRWAGWTGWGVGGRQ